MRRITSRTNAVVSRYRVVARGDDPQYVLLDGPHLVTDALAAGTSIRHAIVAADALTHPEISLLAERLESLPLEIAVASSPVMAAVSPLKAHSKIVAIADRPLPRDDHLFAGPAPLVVIACDVQDPGNLGAMVRVAEAAGASGLIAAGGCADPFGWKALRGSMGSALRLPIAVRATAEEASAEARGLSCRVIATVPHGGRPFFDVDLTGPVAVLIGGEGSGLSQSLIAAAAESVTVPMRPPVESLNTAVTTSLVVYEALRQRDRR